MLITYWGRNDSLDGYAQRQYGGLMKDLNLPVWKAYLNEGKAASRQVMFDWIENAGHDKEYSAEAEGNAIEVVKEIVTKYCHEAGVTLAESARFVGRWEYEVGGVTYVREFMEDGTLNFCKNGKKQSFRDGFTWVYKDGIAYGRKADGAVFESHRLNDAQTLEFMEAKLPPAIREINHIE